MLDLSARFPLRASRFEACHCPGGLHWCRCSRHARPQGLTFALKGPLAPSTLPANDQQPALAQASGGLSFLGRLVTSRLAGRSRILAWAPHRHVIFVAQGTPMKTAANLLRSKA